MNMSINTVGILRRDLDTYLVRTYSEGARLVENHNQIALESNSSLVSISNEGLLSWIKEKLVAIGRKFVVIVNKLIARFSKNRAKIEANIREYQKNPRASVKLPASPKAIGVTIACTAAIAATIVAIIKVRKSENAKAKIKQLWSKMREKINEIKAKFKKEKAESEGEHTCSAKEAEELSKKAAQANQNAEDAVKGAAKNMSNDTNGKSPEDVAGAGEAARATADLAEEAGKMGSHTTNKAEISEEDVSESLKKAGDIYSELRRGFMNANKAIREPHKNWFHIDKSIKNNIEDLEKSGEKFCVNEYDKLKDKIREEKRPATEQELKQFRDALTKHTEDCLAKIRKEVSKVDWGDVELSEVKYKVSRRIYKTDSSDNRKKISRIFSNNEAGSRYQEEENEIRKDVVSKVNAAKSQAEVLKAETDGRKRIDDLIDKYSEHYDENDMDLQKSLIPKLEEKVKNYEEVIRDLSEKYPGTNKYLHHFKADAREVISKAKAVFTGGWGRNADGAKISDYSRTLDVLAKEYISKIKTFKGEDVRRREIIRKMRDAKDVVLRQIKATSEGKWPKHIDKQIRSYTRRATKAMDAVIEDAESESSLKYDVRHYMRSVEDAGHPFDDKIYEILTEYEDSLED